MAMHLHKMSATTTKATMISRGIGRASTDDSCLTLELSEAEEAMMISRGIGRASTDDSCLTLELSKAKGATKASPMFLKSCKTYASKENPSAITRAINIRASDNSTKRIHSKYKRRIRARKRNKIDALPVPSSGPKDTATEWLDIQSSMIVKIIGGVAVKPGPSKPKLYIGGISADSLPELPKGSIAWSVHDKFTIYKNGTGGGCNLPDCCTLPPREWIRDNFKDTKTFYKAFMEILEKNKNLDPRGGGKVPVYEPGTPRTYATFGESAKRFDKGIQNVRRGLDSKKMKWHKEVLHKYFRKVTHVAKGYMDTESICYARYVKAMAQYKGFNLEVDDDDPQAIWPCIAIAANVAMEMHDDDDYFIGAVGVLGEQGYHESVDDKVLRDDSILQYFCFPTMGVAVGLRDGDILLFNPRIAHCISSRATKRENVICTSLYLKTALVGGNDKKRTVEDIPIIL